MVEIAGVDVGKANLDVSVSEGPVLRFDNTAKGITRLLKHLMEQGGLRLSYGIAGISPSFPHLLPHK